MSLTPLALLRADFEKASASSDPNAILGTLATCDAKGAPHARIVVLHALSETGLSLLISRWHQKWGQIQDCPRVELLVWWITLGLQYRLSCTWSEAPPPESAALWNRLPNPVKALDHAYGEGFKPGEPFVSKNSLQDEVASRSANANHNEPPEHVVAIQLHPDNIERLRTSPTDRLHERHQYSLKDGIWECRQLVP